MTIRRDLRAGIEARLEMPQVEEASHHQSRPDEQHQRERGLEDDEPAAHAATAPTDAGPAAPVLERLVEIRARRFDRRDEAEHHPGEDRHDRGEDYDAAVDLDLHPVR
jgi:hypothetical protein